MRLTASAPGLVGAIGVVAGACGCGDNLPADDGCALGVTVFTAQSLWDHPSNPVAAAALASLGASQEWAVTVTADPTVFTPEHLLATDVVVFSVTSGIVLDDAARAALEPYFRAGGGFVATHSGSATEWEWPFYKLLVPLTFKTHPGDPAVQRGRLTIEAFHPISTGLPDPWIVDDEFYTFYERPETLDVDLIYALDESSMGPAYTDDMRVGYHPLAIAHEAAGGRAFYTSLGHPPEAYAEPLFMLMLRNAIVWTAAPHHTARCGP
jgi:type 1 glutamine amidotransferase